ncbi:MAG: tRNA (adenosine(37)-N6)-threonylcarbamoyltransferase complex ATPase subunit type 1 TsaE [Leptospirales bacterium]|nr:tRNA (adenosine(37)-N6)-threonylcarbamoyltransferase complex ATPase subunit type 1 TsaE [Leptospirales bacterium]
MKNIIISNSSDETFALGKKLSEKIRKKSIVAIYGNLGAGKTIFAKGIAAGLSIVDDITSPTFSLMEVYEGNITLYHFDLYRIEDQNEFTNLSFEEYWEGDGVSVIEWPEIAENILPKKRINVYIEYMNENIDENIIDENIRKITIEYPDN